MFTKTKFKKHDRVLLLNDLSISLVVCNVYEEEYAFHIDNKVVLSDGKVYNENELTYYSEPLIKLSSKIGILQEINTKNEEAFKSLKEKFNKLEEQVNGKPKDGYMDYFIYSTWSSMYSGQKKEKVEPSLKERIEVLEKNGVKNPKVKKIKNKKK